MIKAIDIVVIEDSPSDMAILVDHLRRGGFDVRYEHAETADQLVNLLKTKKFAAIISDYNLPGFDALGALKIVKEIGIDVPFIIVSGTIGEETAVAAMKEGAHDYIMKGNLARLVPALEREIREAATREAKRRAQLERENAQNEIKKVNKFLSTILDSLGDTAIYTCNLSADYRITYISSSIELITGFKPSIFLDDPHFWMSAIHNDDAMKLQIGNVFNSDTIARREYRFRHKDGSWIYLYDFLRVVTFPGDSQQTIVGVLVNVTESVTNDLARKKALEQLLEASKMASLGKMAGAIAHEVNNPLSIVTGKARQLVEILETTPVDTESSIKFARVIDETIQRTIRIVNGLRALSRKSEKDPFLRRKLKNIIDSTVAICEAKFKYADIPLSVATLPNEIEIECRETEISQVIVNLLGNAFDAIEHLKDRWVKLEFNSSNQDWIDVIVSDSGPGISKDIREKILQPFFTTKEAGKGTGLGLSISKNIVEDHGGILSIADNSSNTKFIMRLPLRQDLKVERVSSN